MQPKGDYLCSFSRHSLPTEWEWKNYIEHQAEHHADRSFEDEFVSWLRKSGVEYDPQFVFV